MRAELTQEIPHLRRYAMSLARQRDEADDLVQECLVKALGAADKFQPGTNLRAWLFTILRNAFINKTRDRARAMALSDGMARLYGMSSPPAQHASIELRETSDAIDRLPPSQRQALILVVHDGCSYQKAASIMGTPTGTVRSRLSRAREALRAEPVAHERGPVYAASAA